MASRTRTRAHNNKPSPDFHPPSCIPIPPRRLCSLPMSPAAEQPPARWSILTTATYLACSWTWCIGMFLPVILMRDYGPWSFAAFAVPNVLGAALMGVVLMQPGASRSLVLRHGGTIRWFSFITLAFQWFFAIWLLMGVGVGVEGLVVVVAIFGMSAIPIANAHRIAVALWCASIACASWWFTSAAPTMPWHATFPSAKPSALLYLSPICLFGFTLSPYLDGTFHLALQRLPGWRGSIAFLLGFGILFLAMIAFTFCYAPAIIDAANNRGATLGPQWATLPVIVHIALQLGFTMTLHFKERLPGSETIPELQISIASDSSAGPILGIILGAVAFLFSKHGYADLSLTETIYRLFMSFYALFFPAYVWLCMIPTWRAGEPTSRHIKTWLVACALAAPAFWMGFFEHQEIYLLPGLGVVLLARLLIPHPNAVEPSDTTPMQEGTP